MPLNSRNLFHLFIGNQQHPPDLTAALLALEAITPNFTPLPCVNMYFYINR
jgi:hypothetical protein